MQAGDFVNGQFSLKTCLVSYEVSIGIVEANQALIFYKVLYNICKS